MSYQGETYYCSVYVHPQLSHNRHPMDGALEGAGSLLPKKMWFFAHCGKICQWLVLIALPQNI
jgi:hypothetical protein